MAADMVAWRNAVAASSGDLQQALATHKAQVAGIRQRPISDSQKQAEIAASYLAAASKVAALKRADNAALSQAGSQAERQAFAPPAAERQDPAAIMAARDARDRARELEKPADAQALLDEAQAAGDDSLGRAVAQHSYSQGWHGVTGQWAANQPPAVTASLDDAAEVANLGSPAGVMARSMAYYVPVPPELGTRTQGQLQTLANGAMGSYG